MTPVPSFAPLARPAHLALSLAAALLPLVLAGWGTTAFAQTAPSVPVPWAGQVFKQFEPLAVPSAPLRIEPAAAASAVVVVRTIERSGNTAFDTVLAPTEFLLFGGVAKSLDWVMPEFRGSLDIRAG